MSRFTQSCLAATLAIIAALSLLSWLGVWFDDPDIFSHFRLHLAAAAAVIAAASILINARMAALGAALVTLNFAGTLHARADLELPAGGLRLKIVTLNVMNSAANSDAIAAFIEAEQPDIVMLQEVRPNRLGLLMQLRQTFPWQAHCAFETDCWVAILSRHPVSQKGATLMGPRPAGLAWMTFGADLAYLSLATVHMPRPLTFSAHAQLSALADEVAAVAGPVIVAGDFNATAWSGAMRAFSGRSGLVPAGDVAPTWPLMTGRGMRCTVCFPQFQIDHVMVSPDIRVVSRRTGADVGSDHLPLIAEVEVLRGRPAR